MQGLGLVHTAFKTLQETMEPCPQSLPRHPSVLQPLSWASQEGACGFSLSFYNTDDITVFSRSLAHSLSRSLVSVQVFTGFFVFLLKSKSSFPDSGDKSIRRSVICKHFPLALNLTCFKISIYFQLGFQFFLFLIFSLLFSFSPLFIFFTGMY